MMTAPDFEKKQIVFVFSNNKERISFKNDNLIVQDRDENIKLQTTCYRIFALFIVGDFSLTSGLIQRAHKFTFPIILMKQSLNIYESFGSRMEGNVVLRKLQYNYEGLSLAKHIVKNKISNQLAVLKSRRTKDDSLKEAINKLSKYIDDVDLVEDDKLSQLLGIEGNSARIYFKHQFDNVLWLGRQPRIKSDYINAILDIGYTILFNFIESMLNIYGFDTYCGVLHKQFYMRKSLSCDLIEPFRIIVDIQVRKSVNLKQFVKEDFEINNLSYRLKWDCNKKYVSILLSAILEHKNEIFIYIQSYYRAFIKSKRTEEFPIYNWGSKS